MAVVLLAAMAVIPSSGQDYISMAAPRPPSAGCHQHDTVPVPQPVSYRCCQHGHDSAILQNPAAQLNIEFASLRHPGLISRPPSWQVSAANRFSGADSSSADPPHLTTLRV